MGTNIGAILLVAGTCLGSGMIALPMVLVQVGLIPSIICMFVMWAFIYASALVNLELGLHFQKEYKGQDVLGTLGNLGKHFSGRKAQILGILSLGLLSYSLLGVYIYGGTSIIQELLTFTLGIKVSFSMLAIGVSLLFGMIFLFPMTIIDYINRFLFISLVLVVEILILGIWKTIDFNSVSQFPLFNPIGNELKPWIVLMPVVMTSFGFQVIFHTLIQMCKGNAKELKKVILIGTLIPVFVYLFWTCGVQTIIFQKNISFYNKMMAGKVDVGGLIRELSRIKGNYTVQLLVWWTSIFAIATSFIGVGLGLYHAIVLWMPLKNGLGRFSSSIVTVLPPLILTLCIPNAFISVLGFAGMILCIIAILLPGYLFTKLKKSSAIYPEVYHKLWLSLCVLMGCVVFGFELINILK